MKRISFLLVGAAIAASTNGKIATASSARYCYLIKTKNVKTLFQFMNDGNLVIYRNISGNTSTFYGTYIQRSNKIYIKWKPIFGYTRVSKKEKMILREEDTYEMKGNSLIALQIKMNYRSFDGKKKGVLMTPVKNVSKITKVECP